VNADYAITNLGAIASPALVFYPELIRANVARALAMVGGDPRRLRPHVKTHKTREIVCLALEAGIHKHKCATLAEAELLADCGVLDVLVAYPVVGPNVSRFIRLVQTYPAARFSVIADHLLAVEALSAEAARRGVEVDVLVDLDVGMHRTGITPGPEAIALYEEIDRLPGIRPGGLHAYDGHNNQPDFETRRRNVHAIRDVVLTLRGKLEGRGLPVPWIVAGGTPGFAIWSQLDVPGLECSPGTCFLHDHGYGEKFAELAEFTPAALVLTRVVSRPTANRLTLDAGYKAIAGDPPLGKRCLVLDLPDAVQVGHSEEHLVLETPSAERYRPGDVLFVVPAHVCPTCALHRQAYVVESGRIVGAWAIAARDRAIVGDATP
jgi:D-serine deaminase-like pyridoxal phosphate-dependent protein